MWCMRMKTKKWNTSIVSVIIKRILIITRLDQVIEDNRMLMMSIPGINAVMVSRWIIAAKAFHSKTAYRLPDDEWDLLSPDACIVYDIETDITQTRVFCVSYWDPESSTVK